MSAPPSSSSNHRFHSYGWTRASNFIAKAYHKDGEIDTSEEAKDAVRNDITLQYEAQYWVEKFNEKDPPKKLVFIRAYAMEFPDRPGKPWFAVERYISGTDSYGCGFTKHNTNAGFVDEDLHRVTPQVFSAFSFYESEGNRLVADMQGVGDLYTDPQGTKAHSRTACDTSCFFRFLTHCFSNYDCLLLQFFPVIIVLVTETWVQEEWHFFSKLSVKIP